MSTIQARKIEYIVHMDRLDDDGRPVGELHTEQPLTIWAHQLDQVPAQVAAIVAQAEQQAAAEPEPDPAPASDNRTQRRASARRKPAKPPAVD